MKRVQTSIIKQISHGNAMYSMVNNTVMVNNGCLIMVNNTVLYT